MGVISIVTGAFVNQLLTGRAPPCGYNSDYPLVTCYIAIENDNL